VNIEIEAKMLLRDPGALEDRLRSLGARQGAALRENNTFFDTREAGLKFVDQGLRLRVERDADGGPDRVTLTHKGPRAHGQLKSRWETEVGVTDARAAAELLSALGFLPVFSFEKRRQMWHLDGCQVAIDELPYLGRFVEIEGPSDEVVLRLRERLGLGSAALIHASYISMLTTHMAQQNIGGQEACFEAPPAERIPSP
jgi:adenylate cyclase class 2